MTTKNQGISAIVLAIPIIFRDISAWTKFVNQPKQSNKSTALQIHTKFCYPIYKKIGTLSKSTHL